MTTQTLIRSALSALLLLPTALVAEDRPNVIFIITDDQRREDFGFLEGKSLTPNIDRLAKEGVYFENSYTCSTVCTPSRYACITGRYPSRCTDPGFLRDITPEGVTQVYFNTHLEKDRPNLPKALQAAGYTTGLVGKWHMGAHLKGLPKVPKGADPTDPAIRKILEQQQQALCNSLQDHGFNSVSRAYAGNPLDSTSLKNADLAHHNMDWVTEGALEFIETNHKKPFFLYFSTTLPHSPDPLDGMQRDPRSTPLGILDKAPVGMPSREEIFRTVEKAGFPKETAPDTWLDAGIGAILNKLETHRIADNTLIIYFNDHGMEHASKSSLYQGALRTPSILRWPGKVLPHASKALISNVDIAATILDATGTKPLPDMPLDGTTYLPHVMLGSDGLWRESIYAEIGFTRTVVTKDWKYLAFRLPPSQIPDKETGLAQQQAMLKDIKAKHSWVKWEADPNAKISHVGGPPGGNFLIRLTMAAKPPYLTNYHDADQLYHLAHDPLETTNLANDPKHAAKLAEMKELLRKQLRDLPGTFGDLKQEPEPPTVTIQVDQTPPTVTIEVDPHSTRSIAGHSELDRKRYFSICDPGKGFESHVGSDKRYDYLIKELNINFGRSLGLVNYLTRSERAVREDADRPGHTDIPHLVKFLEKRRQTPSTKLQRDFPGNLDVALHGARNAYPDFIGTWLTEAIKNDASKGGHGPTTIPAQSAAAAELAATVLKHGYSDFDRPRYYEPINEPHWSYLTEPEKIATWHLATMEAVHKQCPEVLVGGPCNSVGYLYSKGYQSFNGVQAFIDATEAKLDFYSFHVYDYHRWNGQEFEGAILSGLPLEGVLDLVPNYTSINHGKEVKIVVSEHGGYATAVSGDDSHTVATTVAKQRFPGSGFEWELKARSIHNFVQTNSIIANTLAFIDHPHTVAKVVPFMLLDTSAWDPHYYASMFVRKDFKKSGELVPTALLQFYELFRDLRGHRVVATCSDPDIQLRAFVDGATLFIIAHNLADKPEVLEINAPTPESTVVRRYGRDDKELTPFLREEAASLDSITLGARQTLLIKAHYPANLESRRTLHESIYYGNAVKVSADKPTTLTVSVPQSNKVESAILRIGYNRPADAGKAIQVLLNDHLLSLPTEDSAPRFTHEKHGYSTTKLIPLDPSLLKDANSIRISFPDGKPATIGSVVIRASTPR